MPYQAQFYFVGVPHQGRPDVWSASERAVWDSATELAEKAGDQTDFDTLDDAIEYIGHDYYIFKGFRSEADMVEFAKDYDGHMDHAVRAEVRRFTKSDEDEFDE